MFEERNISLEATAQNMAFDRSRYFAPKDSRNGLYHVFDSSNFHLESFPFPDDSLPRLFIDLYALDLDYLQSNFINLWSGFEIVKTRKKKTKNLKSFSGSKFATQGEIQKFRSFIRKLVNIPSSLSPPF